MNSNAINIVAIVQGRMGSSRLPGKVMLDLGGMPMIARMVHRVRRARMISRVVIATTDDAADDPLADYCQKQGFPLYRGSQFDVLDRYYQAALLFSADVVVRITADCPMIDPAEIDRTVQRFFESGADFAANRLPPPLKRTTPIGFDTEVCTFAALARAWREADQKFEREHVMPYLYATPGRFKVEVVDHDPDLSHLRWTVDTPEDLALARKVYAAFGNRDDFTFADLMALFDAHPDWLDLNAGVSHRGFLDVDERSSDDVDKNRQ